MINSSVINGSVINGTTPNNDGVALLVTSWITAIESSTVFIPVSSIPSVNGSLVNGPFNTTPSATIIDGVASLSVTSSIALKFPIIIDLSGFYNPPANDGITIKFGEVDVNPAAELLTVTSVAALLSVTRTAVGTLLSNSTVTCDAIAHDPYTRAEADLTVEVTSVFSGIDFDPYQLAEAHIASVAQLSASTTPIWGIRANLLSVIGIVIGARETITAEAELETITYLALDANATWSPSVNWVVNTSLYWPDQLILAPLDSIPPLVIPEDFCDIELPGSTNATVEVNANYTSTNNPSVIVGKASLTSTANVVGHQEVNCWINSTISCTAYQIRHGTLKAGVLESCIILVARAYREPPFYSEAQLYAKPSWAYAEELGAGGYVVEYTDRTLGAGSIPTTDISVSIEVSVPTDAIISVASKVQTSALLGAFGIGELFLDTPLGAQTQTEFNYEYSLGYEALYYTEHGLGVSGVLELTTEADVDAGTGNFSEEDADAHSKYGGDSDLGSHGHEIIDLSWTLAVGAGPTGSCNDFLGLINRSLGDELTFDTDVDVLTNLMAMLQDGVYNLVSDFDKLRDVDELPDKFIPYLRREVSIYLPDTDNIDKAEFIKEAKNWYSGKGVQASYDYIGALTGLEFEIWEPNAWILRTNHPRTTIDGGLYSQIDDGVSRLGRLRDGIYWSNYTYAITVRPPLNHGPVDVDELISLFDLVHPAGTKYFLEIKWESYIHLFAEDLVRHIYISDHHLIDFDIECRLDEFLITDEVCKYDLEPKIFTLVTPYDTSHSSIPGDWEFLGSSWYGWTHTLIPLVSCTLDNNVYTDGLCVPDSYVRVKTVIPIHSVKSLIDRDDDVIDDAEWRYDHTLFGTRDRDYIDYDLVLDGSTIDGNSIIVSNTILHYIEWVSIHTFIQLGYDTLDNTLALDTNASEPPNRIQRVYSVSTTVTQIDIIKSIDSSQYITDYMYEGWIPPVLDSQGTVFDETENIQTVYPYGTSVTYIQNTSVDLISSDVYRDNSIISVLVGTILDKDIYLDDNNSLEGSIYIHGYGVEF